MLNFKVITANSEDLLEVNLQTFFNELTKDGSDFSFDIKYSLAISQNNFQYFSALVIYQKEEQDVKQVEMSIKKPN